VKLHELRIEGFGKLVDRAFEFDPHVNVVCGPNEAGKSTLTAALVATLFGVGRKEQREGWRPWSGTRYAAALRYSLDDGRSFEVQRDFNDPKSARAYDENGNDVSAELAVDKIVNPGQVHLGFPLEVFLNAACMIQGAAHIDGARAERISTALAHALDGGPREDAALGAIRRLDEALASHVGTKRATVNAPLRHLCEQIETAEKRAEDVRAKLRTLDDVRDRRDRQTRRAAELEHALADHDRRARALRASSLRSRLEALLEIRDEKAALHSERAQYGDVDDYALGRFAEAESRYRTWQTAEALAASARETADETRMTIALEGELAERMRDGGTLGETQFAALQEAAAEATDARIKATFAAAQVQGSRRSIDGGNEFFGAVFAAGTIFASLAVALAIFHQWASLLGAIVATFFFFLAWLRWNRRRDSMHAILKMQRTADDATKMEREAVARVAAVLEPLGVPSIEEFARRRERALALAERKANARRNADRASTARSASEAAGKQFDVLVRTLVAPTGTRDGDLEAVRLREARRSTRDGIELRLGMLDVRRTDVLGNDDETALHAELDELLRAGVQANGVPGSQRAFEAERAALERSCTESRTSAAALGAEVRAAETQLEDLAALDEWVQSLREKARRLERFEVSVSLARQCIEDRTREAHQKFARRLTDYASRTLNGITKGRYIDVRVDPTTLAVRVRAPETGAIVDVDRLSAGTREQAYLVVRLAMVRMFAEGLETTPIILDDPFAYWDEERIARGLPILKAFARDGQLILFTTSRQLAAAAAADGAHRIDLDGADAARPVRAPGEAGEPSPVPAQPAQN
jgi:DNA repair exonuclease SbcCD ATPase subunit